MVYAPLDTPKPVAEGVWIVDGPEVRFYGIPFPTRMTLIRLADGGLWVHSPTALSPALQETVKNLGPVRHLIAPNWIHYTSLGQWSDAFPDATNWAAPGVAKRAEQNGLSLRIDGDLQPGVEPPWATEIAWRLVEGSPVHREAVFFHRTSRTLILTDLIENFERKQVPLWLWLILRLVGNTDPNGKMPRDMAWTFRKGKPALRAAVQEMIAWAPERVVLAHGRWYERDAVAELRRAFRSVLD